MLNRVRPLATPLLWVVGVCGALLLLLPRGFPNYDTIYYLLWGRELAQGMSPDYGAPLAPTPHPLYDLLGAVVAPLGDGGVTVAMVVAYVSLALVGWLVYRLGREWLSAPVGLVAAAVVLTSAPFLSNGLRAYIDIPYIALCLGALLLETRRPRAGAPVLVLLALAGLLRPEAWLFSGVYALYLGWSAGRYADHGAGAGGTAGTSGAVDSSRAIDTSRADEGGAPSPARPQEGPPPAATGGSGTRLRRLAEGLLAKPGLLALAAAGPLQHLAEAAGSV
ncbi:MAG TPA: glycosyltransferase family 39 protein [Solirubrobacterales bacterium]|nr:glycosyltransferase family 39 protein [Solirubrobacterales bacterium]